MSGFLRTGKRKNARLWVTFLPSGKTVRVDAGTSVLEAVLAADEVIEYECGGRARCGSCHVMVRQGRRDLSKIRPKERDGLSRLGNGDTLSRLACQALLGTRDVTVELLTY